MTRSRPLGVITELAIVRPSEADIIKEDKCPSDRRIVDDALKLRVEVGWVLLQRVKRTNEEGATGRPPSTARACASLSGRPVPASYCRRGHGLLQTRRSKCTYQLR
jgi:hypothetical protein